VHTASAKFTQRFLDQGFQMVMLTTDRGAMASNVKADVARLSGWTPMKPVAAPGKGGY
jgi:hypothetical protein